MFILKDSAGLRLYFNEMKAFKMITVNKIRSAIRAISVLPTSSIRKLGQLLGVSHQTMMRLKKRCKRAEVILEEAEQLTDTELKQKLYPTITENNSYKRQPDVEYIVVELTKPRGKGKTASVLYLEYVAKDPSTAMSRSHFFRIVNKALKRTKLAMKQLHAAGEVVYIDYAGHKIYYLSGGKKVWVKVFVAVLGASKKVFAHATYGEKTLHWIDGMTRMFNDFGGVTEVVSMDNATALVAKPGLIANLTRNVAAFGEHYKCIMDTCRVGKPQDKAHAELGVKFVTQRILRPMMQDHTFFSLEEINQYLARQVELLNSLPFQGLDISRNDLFERNEKPALQPLPAQPYLMIVDQLKQKVPANYHVKYLKHEYSVPYQHRGELVDIVVDQSNLRVFFESKLIATHVVKDEPMGATTLLEHMPAEHLADYQSMDKDANLKWAKNTGEAVEKLVAKWYSKTANAKSRAIGKRCMALMKLSTKNGEDVLADACEYANLHGLTTPSDIALIINVRNDADGFDALPSRKVAHKNIRGAGYFGGHHEA